MRRGPGLKSEGEAAAGGGRKGRGESGLQDASVGKKHLSGKRPRWRHPLLHGTHAQSPDLKQRGTLSRAVSTLPLAFPVPFHPPLPRHLPLLNYFCSCWVAAAAKSVRVYLPHSPPAACTPLSAPSTGGGGGGSGQGVPFLWDPGSGAQQDVEQQPQAGWWGRTQCLGAGALQQGSPGSLLWWGQRCP